MSIRDRVISELTEQIIRFVDQVDDGECGVDHGEPDYYWGEHTYAEWLELFHTTYLARVREKKS